MELDPRRTSVYLPLAKALHACGERAEAIGALRKWLASEPRTTEVPTAKALMEEINAPGGDLPGGSNASFHRALEMLQQRDNPFDAIAIFEQLVRDHPQAAIAHTMLALFCERVDDVGRAVDELHRAAALAPLEARNHCYLGELYLARGQPAKAKRALERCLELHPLLEDAHFRLGELAFQEADWQSARSHFAAAALLSSTVAPRAMLARVLQISGDVAGADRELREMLAANANDPQLLLQLGMLHMEAHLRASDPTIRESRKAQAVHWFRELLSREGDNVAAANALRTLGVR
jgi:tetratricopeptide (TPR) repeat protein